VIKYEHLPLKGLRRFKPNHLLIPICSTINDILTHSYVEPESYSARAPLDPSVLPKYSDAVQRARDRHQELFDKIAASHLRIAAERPEPVFRSEGSGEPFEVYE